ncbi:MAG: CoA transferase [Deltaproteobacteria bacterium]|nr:CoA transferase [Deltaproteobacteria bacterium]
MASLLESFRVLDLTDHKGFFCGKILADLGADVVKVEKPGGDPARRIGPFFRNIEDPEKSLNWFAYNLNKRSITLDVENSDGKTLFRKLAKNSDFVIESYARGGPYKDYKGSDIVGMAMGGLAYITGKAEDSPVRVSFPQSYLLASAEAAASTMIAHYHRETTGQGQHVDVSIQASVAGKLANAIPTWELNRTLLKREGSFMFGRGAKLRMRLLWRCKDGYITFALMGGKLGAKSNEVVARWIIDEGLAPEFFTNLDWRSLDIANQTQEEQDRLEEVVGRFFAKYTKAELYRKANQEGVLLCPQSSFSDILENGQLQARDFWIKVEHPELGETITYPGPFLKASSTPLVRKQRAPLIGEHNEEVYKGELGLSEDEITRMRRAGVI